MCVLWWCVVVVGLVGLTERVWGKLGVEGEISFDIVEPRTPGAGAIRALGTPPGNVTRAAPVECVYQYPESRQVDAMLSNMMNQLTKMFVRVNQYLSRATEEGVGGAGGAGGKRFKVVRGQTASFFDLIYYNMTEEYRRFVNVTRARVVRAGRDPCAHQAEIRDVWRALLDSAQESLRRAAVACVEQYLRMTRAEESAGARGRARSRASRLLHRELARVRRDHLALLCDNFQLCYNELL